MMNFVRQYLSQNAIYGSGLDQILNPKPKSPSPGPTWKGEDWKMEAKGDYCLGEMTDGWCLVGGWREGP